MTSSGKHWFVAQTHAQREALAAHHLQKQGFSVFFPKRLRTVRHARRVEQRLVGYFPGYLFVHLDLTAERWRSVNGTIGVKRLVMFGERPARAPADLIECLRAITSAEGLIDASLLLQPGDRVRVLAGPFADLIGTLERVEGGARVRILMDLVGGVTPLITDGANVALAS